MKSIEERDYKIKALEKHLRLIRTSLGWTAQRLGDEIGVVRQTIAAIENGTGKLNKTQYLAMRSVISDRIKENPEECEITAALLDAFVDNPSKYTDLDRREILSKAEIISPAMLTKNVDKKEINNTWKVITFTALTATAAAAITVLINALRKR